MPEFEELLDKLKSMKFEPVDFVKKLVPDLCPMDELMEFLNEEILPNITPTELIAKAKEFDLSSALALVLEVL